MSTRILAADGRWYEIGLPGEMTADQREEFGRADERLTIIREWYSRNVDKNCSEDERASGFLAWLEGRE